MNTRVKGIDRWRGCVTGLALALLPAAGEAASLSVGTNYQESSNVTSNAPPTPGACNSLVFCYIEFNKVPVGKQLIVTQVSCQLSISVTAAEVVSMYLAPRRPNGAAVERFQILIPSTMPSNQPGYNLVVNSNTYQLFDDRDRPEVFIGLNAAASTLGFCSISGQMVDKV